MSANGMKSDASQIEAVAKLIRENCEKYTVTYKDVFASFRLIDKAWNGDDNNSFNEKVMSFEKDFISMIAYFENVEGHLKHSAEVYKTVERVNKKSAQKLSK